MACDVGNTMVDQNLTNIDITNRYHDFFLSYKYVEDRCYRKPYFTDLLYQKNILKVTINRAFLRKNCIPPSMLRITIFFGVEVPGNTENPMQKKYMLLADPSDSQEFSLIVIKERFYKTQISNKKNIIIIT